MRGSPGILLPSALQLTKLLSEDFLLRAGKAGGQTVIGDTAASGNLLLQSTANATRGFIRAVDPLQLADPTTAAKALQFGDGAAGYDTKLWRSAANTLTLGGSDVAASFLNLSRTNSAVIADLSMGVASTNSPTYTVVNGGTLTGEKSGVATAANPLLVSAIPNTGGFYWDKVTKAAGSAYSSADITAHMSLVAGRLNLPVVGVNAGLLLGGDVLLYRQAADVLGTPDTLYQTATTCRRSMGVGWQEYVGDYLKPTFEANGTSISGIYMDATLVESNLYWRGLTTRISVPINKTLSECYGLYIFNPIGDGAVTNNYGIYIPDMTKGTGDYGIAIEGADTCVLWLSSAADNTDAPNGIMFGASKDTNLYRSAANMLKTDDSLTVAGDSSVLGSFTVTNAKNITFSTSTGTKIGTGATQKLGFWNVTPVVRPSAFTQTYSTASKTVANLTSAAVTNNTGGVVSTTFAAITAGAAYAQADMTACKDALASTADQLTKLNANIATVKQNLNSVIDDLQAIGLLQ